MNAEKSVLRAFDGVEEAPILLNGRLWPSFFFGLWAAEAAPTRRKEIAAAQQHGRDAHATVQWAILAQGGGWV
jgi:hypothetical protein